MNVLLSFLFFSPFHSLILSAWFFSTTHYLPRYFLPPFPVFYRLEHISSSFFKQFRWDTKRRRVSFSGISLDKHHGRCPVASLGHAAPGIRRRLASRRPFTFSPPLFWPIANLFLSFLSLSLFLLTNKWTRQIDNASTTCIISIVQYIALILMVLSYLRVIKHDTLIRVIKHE